MGRQAPKWLGAWMIVVGGPIALMNVVRTNDQLNALSSSEPRVERCNAITAEYISVPSMRVKVCNCIVEKVIAQDALTRLGGHDQTMFAGIASACSRGDWD